MFSNPRLRKLSVKYNKVLAENKVMKDLLENYRRKINELEIEKERLESQVRLMKLGLNIK
jgi:hypothetical protein